MLPALANVMSELWWPFFDAAVAMLVRGRTLRGGSKKHFAPAVRLVLDFGTWRTLTKSDLDTSAAADLTADLVRGV